MIFNSFMEYKNLKLRISKRKEKLIKGRSIYEEQNKESSFKFK